VPLSLAAGAADASAKFRALRGHWFGLGARLEKFSLALVQTALERVVGAAELYESDQILFDSGGELLHWEQVQILNGARLGVRSRRNIWDATNGSGEP
jgi:hypothetical protein